MNRKRVLPQAGHDFPGFPGHHWRLPVLLLVVALLGGGCATLDGQQAAAVEAPTVSDAAAVKTDAATEIEPTVVSYPEYRDPLMGLNRAIFAFNDVTYRYLLIPLSEGYLRVVPEPVRNSVGNFFYNIKTPVYAVNHLLQGEPRRTGRNLLRFGINTTIGLLGLFDPASKLWGLQPEETHFEQTLADYGAGYGVYLVLPIFGPSDLRNGASLVVDHFLNPVIYLTENPETNVILGVDFFQQGAPGASRYETIRQKSKDPYLFFRNLYLQGVQRDAEY